ncbi:MAG: PA14 domain-containing protein, partial [Planctomycetota bacterium]
MNKSSAYLACAAVLVCGALAAWLVPGRNPGGSGETSQAHGSSVAARHQGDTEAEPGEASGRTPQAGAETGAETGQAPGSLQSGDRAADAPAGEGKGGVGTGAGKVETSAENTGAAGQGPRTNPGKAGSTSLDASVSVEQERVEQPDPLEHLEPGTGLLGEYWKLIDEPVDDIQQPQGEPTLARIDPQIDFADAESFGFPFLARNLRVRWSGFLRVNEEGTYAFLLGSDDGSRLTIDGQRVIDMNRRQPYRQASGEIHLRPGLHAVEVMLIQNEADCACSWSWTPPGGTQSVVPAEALYPANARSLEVPQIDSADPPTGRRGQTVLLKGTGLPGPGEAFELYFNEVLIDDARSVDEEGEHAILATVPPGIEIGDFHVATGGVRSPGFRYEVKDVFGLLVHYRRSADPISSLDEAPLEGPVDFERIENQLDFQDRDSFQLPFPPDRFSAVARGFLYVSESGLKRFRLISDDHSRLRINGVTVIENQGIAGREGMHTVGGEIELVAGMNPIEVEMFQNREGAGFRLHWEEGRRFQYRPVPKANLYPPVSDATLSPSLTVTRLDPSAAAPGELVRIIGEGFGFDLPSTRVTLSGKELDLELVTNEEIQARVPTNAVSGDLVVQAGTQTSTPLEFTVRGRGLTAEYFQFAEPILEIPAMPQRAPDHATVVSRILFGEKFSFQLPFPTVQFAARYRGVLTAPRAGEYLFDLRSNNGSRLLIDG